MKHKSKAAKVAFFILVAPVFIALFGFAVMLLWNWLMPDIFGLKLITFWQAIGLILLSKLLFGGFSGKPKSKHRGYQKCDKPYGEWKQRWKDKWKEDMDAKHSTASASSHDSATELSDTDHEKG